MLEVRPTDRGPAWSSALVGVLSLVEAAVVAASVAVVLAAPTALAVIYAARVQTLDREVDVLERRLDAALAGHARRPFEGRFDAVLRRVARRFGREVVVAPEVFPGRLEFDVALPRAPFAPRVAVRQLDDAAWARGLRVVDDGRALRVERDRGPVGWRCDGTLSACAAGLEPLLGVRVLAAAPVGARRVALAFGAGEGALEALRRSVAAAGIALDARGRTVEATALPVPEPARPACDADRVRIDPMGPDRYVVRRTGVECLLDAAPLRRAVRVLPVSRDGRVVGVALYGIAPGAVAWRLGLRNGDVLRRVNGYDVSSPDRCLEAYARLRTVDTLTVEIERRGAVRRLVYRIV